MSEKIYSFGRHGYAQVEVFRDVAGKRRFRVRNTVTNVVIGVFDSWDEAAAEARYIAERYEGIQKQMGW